MAHLPGLLLPHFKVSTKPEEDHKADFDVAAKEEHLRARSDPSVRFSIQTVVPGVFALGMLISNAGVRGLE